MTKRNPKRAVNRYAMQAALGMMRKVHKASRIASYMGSMATVTQGAVTMVAIATTVLPGPETLAAPTLHVWPTRNRLTYLTLL